MSFSLPAGDVGNLFRDRRRQYKGWQIAPADPSQKLYQPHSRIDNPLETFP
jgi:hypothetical protein